MTIKNIDAKYITTWENVNLFVYHANKGEGHDKHEHEYAHAVACFQGKIKISKEDISIILTPDNEPIRLREKEWHEIEAIEDGTIFMNIHTKDKY